MNRFITVQVGARRNYAVPSILEDAGMLEALYTDMCADAGLGKWLDTFCPKVLKQKGLKRLLDRKVSSTLKDKVKTCDLSAVQYLINQKLAADSPVKQHRALLKFSRDFGREAVEKGLGKATHVFSMFGEGLALLQAAKQQGLKTVTEIYLSPATHRIVQAERAKFPGLESQISNEIIERDYENFSRVCELTDLFLVPSEFVRTGLGEFGVDSSRCRYIPYAVGDSWFNIESKPIKGRILFVGTAELRKGIHTLGQAARELSDQGYEFRVAGGVSDTVRQHSITQGLNFLGRIPRTQIQKEYASADIFVLPSLAEGSSESTYEALALGLPTIVTEATGSVVRDGIDGLVIPSKNPAELARSIVKIVENRSLRHQMSCSAKQRAQDYTWKQYAKRLESTLSQA